MQINFLRTEDQRPATAAEGCRPHSQNLRVKRARAIDIGDRQRDMIDRFDFHGIGNPSGRGSALLHYSILAGARASSPGTTAAAPMPDLVDERDYVAATDAARCYDLGIDAEFQTRIFGNVPQY